MSDHRMIQNTPRYKEGMEQQGRGLVAGEVLISQDETKDEPTALRQYALQKSIQDPVAYVASSNPDVMYLS